MKNILLVCAAGMSTSLLVSKMKEAAKGQNIEAEINAISGTELRKHIDKVDVILLGPQVSYQKGEFEKMANPIGVPVEVINSVDYGTMNGEKVLNRALEISK
ncbi:PTS sugar transporter subunit IIB [Domibacillus sp. A3M-37]|uniref:PTS sugar transporter subunit IIB n=1 Tax=Domibacillus sp. A3M-37 TaxID=2962037 RepID=UPI0020B709E6|nr:PTS sugar transporter subunit IIB [Domibacillus sp. A3M-37]MCP3763714.1 PTS sugar transporter subunit IIB [Domibacillus sp. A3M-37]